MRKLEVKFGLGSTRKDRHVRDWDSLWFITYLYIYENEFGFWMIIQTSLLHWNPKYAKGSEPNGARKCRAAVAEGEGHGRIILRRMPTPRFRRRIFFGRGPFWGIGVATRGGGVGVPSGTLGRSGRIPEVHMNGLRAKETQENEEIDGQHKWRETLTLLGTFHYNLNWETKGLNMSSASSKICLKAGRLKKLTKSRNPKNRPVNISSHTLKWSTSTSEPCLLSWCNSSAPWDDKSQSHCGEPSLSHLPSWARPAARRCWGRLCAARRARRRGPGTTQPDGGIGEDGPRRERVSVPSPLTRNLSRPPPPPAGVVTIAGVVHLVQAQKPSIFTTRIFTEPHALKKT